MEAAGLSKKGLRQENQDCFYIDLSRGLFIVADGMGGHRAGRIASTIAIEAAEQFFAANDCLKYTDKKQLVLEALLNANKEILDYASIHPETTGMGTTMTLLFLDRGFAYIAHIGDSRAYLITPEKIAQLTDDHSYVGELLRNGELSEKEAARHPQKNLLTRALGVSYDVKVDVISYEVMPGEYLLLCTDGLFNMVDEFKLKAFVIENPVKEAVHQMVELAMLNGGRDNITAVLVRNC